MLDVEKLGKLLVLDL